MFNDIEEIPEDLLEFYEESSLEDGTIIYKEKGRGECRDDVALVLKRNSNEDIVNKFLGFANNLLSWKFHDDYLEWLDKKPMPEDAMAWGAEPASPTEDGELVYSSELLAQMLLDWENTKPIRKTRNLSDYSEYDRWAKLQGVLFEGVRCSATKEDMWGLKAVEDIIRSGVSVNFSFDSGETLVLTQDNVDDFKSVWVPFRLQFFS